MMKTTYSVQYYCTWSDDFLLVQRRHDNGNENSKNENVIRIRYWWRTFAGIASLVRNGVEPTTSIRHTHMGNHFGPYILYQREREKLDKNRRHDTVRTWYMQYCTNNFTIVTVQCGDWLIIRLLTIIKHRKDWRGYYMYYIRYYICGE